MMRMKKFFLSFQEGSSCIAYFFRRTVHVSEIKLKNLFSQSWNTKSPKSSCVCVILYYSPIQNYRCSIKMLSFIKYYFINQLIISTISFSLGTIVSQREHIFQPNHLSSQVREKKQFKPVRLITMIDIEAQIIDIHL